MAANKKSDDHSKMIGLPWLIVLVILIWVIGWVVVDSIYSDVAQRGAFSDKFGFVNSLFSATAFTGIIYSIYLQKNELALQRQEVSETRKEFAQQNFETTFFNLLKNQQEITSKIKATFFSLGGSLTSFEHHTFSGLDFFKQSKNELKLILGALQYTSHQYYDYELFSSIEPAQDEEEENVIYQITEYTNANSNYAITQQE